MDGDFQQQYQDAERAYGEGDYAEAHRLASGLLEQLVDQPQDQEAQAAVLGWRAFVALLLGHIELYGRDNPNHPSFFLHPSIMYAGKKYSQVGNKVL